MLWFRLSDLIFPWSNFSHRSVLSFLSGRCCSAIWFCHLFFLLYFSAWRSRSLRIARLCLGFASQCFCLTVVGQWFPLLRTKIASPARAILLLARTNRTRPGPAVPFFVLLISLSLSGTLRLLLPFRPRIWSERPGAEQCYRGQVCYCIRILHADIYFSPCLARSTDSLLDFSCFCVTPPGLLAGFPGPSSSLCSCRRTLILSHPLWCESLQVEFGLFLSRRVKWLEGSWFKLLSHSDFLNTPNRCSVKWLWGYKLLFDLIFVVDLARVLVGIDLCFRCSF
jgi:hypothetical protein